MTRRDPSADKALRIDHFEQPLAQADPVIAASIEHERRRQQNQIELIASENFVSLAVLQAQGSVMTNKTVEGYPAHRYYGGAEFADEIEAQAIARACALFGCRFANVQPHSGSNANQAAYLAVLEPGDTILSMDTAAGGHISHGHPATLTGRSYRVVTYGLDRDTERIDYDELQRSALAHRPRLIIAGGSAYSRVIDFERIASIARSVDASFLVDMAHFAGLVATGLHPHPFPHADIVTTTTYKSLRGARGGMILWNDERLSKRINNGVFPGVQGSVMLHAVAAKAVCLQEATQPAFRHYSEQVIRNAQAMAQSLTRSAIRVVSGGTDTGLMLVDLRPAGVTGAVAVDWLERAGLTCNKNLIPFDPQPAEVASGLRLSANAATARGFGEAEFTRIGQWIAEVVAAIAAPGAPATTTSVVDEVRAGVFTMCADFPFYR